MAVRHVGIVGCGVAGMAAALFLHRAGVRVSLYERFETPRPLGAGLLIQPTGQAVLARLGLAEAAFAAGARIAGIDGRTPRGRQVILQRYRDRDPLYTGLGIQRGALFQLLYGAVEAEGIPIHCGRPVDDIEADASQASLVLEGGGREGPFDLAIVADGAFSTLRHRAGRASTDHTYRWGAVWALCDHPPGWPGDYLLQVYQGPRVMIGALPVGILPGAPREGAQISFFWSLKAADLDAWRARGLDAWRAEVLALWPALGPVLDSLRSMDQVLPATYRDYHHPRPWQGRVLLIGDAAHAMSPQFGQGANLALADAALLGEAFDQASDLETCLNLWWRWRRPHVSIYQRASRWFTPIFQGDSRVIGALRDMFLPLACRAPVSKQVGLALMTGVKYGWIGTLDPTTLRPARRRKTGNTPANGL